MKKLTLILTLFIILSVAVIYCLIAGPRQRKASGAIIKTKQIAAYGSQEPTGLSRAEADKMVWVYRHNLGVYGEKTSCWFSQRFILDIDSALKVDSIKYKADGIRLYIARQGKSNIFLVVPTTNAGPDPKDPKKNIHQDRFAKITNNIPYPVAAGVMEDASDLDGTLFNKPNCSDDNIVTGEHFISCADASCFVTNTTSDLSDTINTYSEWFPTSVVRHFAKEFFYGASNPHKPDGMRIYLGRHRKQDTKGKKRHILIFVTTTRNSNGKHYDYYGTYFHEMLSLKDNGEQCLNNCNGATLPSAK